MGLEIDVVNRLNRLENIPDSIRELVHPLEAFYTRSGSPLPPLEAVDGEAIPEPYRSLLVHDNDMTSTLETYHGGAIKVEVLGRKQTGMEYFREVVLVLETTRQAVEFGAIDIYLDRFPEAARREILEEEWPLGKVLKAHEIPFLSRPKAFLRLASDRLINKVLNLTGVEVLFGRRNTLSAPSGAVLAEIVEILPPLAGGGK